MHIQSCAHLCLFPLGQISGIRILGQIVGSLFKSLDNVGQFYVNLARR